MGLASFRRSRREKHAQTKQRHTSRQAFETQSTEELKQKAKEKGIKGFGNMKRETLIDRLRWSNGYGGSKNDTQN